MKRKSLLKQYQQNHKSETNDSASEKKQEISKRKEINNIKDEKNEKNQKVAPQVEKKSTIQSPKQLDLEIERQKMSM